MVTRPKIKPKTKRADKLWLKFCEEAGANTVGTGPQGQPLMYRWDVERFADVIFDGIPTWFD